MFTAQFLEGLPDAWAEVDAIACGWSPESPQARWVDDRVGIADAAGRPLLRIDLAYEHSYTFAREVRSSASVVVIGASGNCLVVKPHTREVRSFADRQEAFIESVERPEDLGEPANAFGFIVSSVFDLWHLDEDGNELWHVETLAIGGMVLNGVHAGLLNGSAQWDQPDGWAKFSVDLKTGQLVQAPEPYWSQWHKSIFR